MLRTVLLYVMAAALVASQWLRLEDPRGSGSRVVLILMLALAPALVPGARRRALAAAGALLAACAVAFRLSPLDARPFDDRHDFVGPALSSFRTGFLDFYDVLLPFDAERHPLMHGVLLLAIFGFGLGLGLAIAARRPVAAVLVLVVGAGWPATLMSAEQTLAQGAVILAAALLLFAGLSARDGAALSRALPAALAVVLVALAASTSPAVAKGAFLDWESWDFYTRPDKPVSVRYVWDSRYGGIDFPKKKTTVLLIKAGPRSLYWRATTLDVFNGAGWIEDLDQILPPPGVSEGLDPLLPPGARDEKKWLRQNVTVKALRDYHLVGGSVPVAYSFEDGPLGDVRFGRGGIAILRGGLSADQRYTVWSYAPEPSPSELAASKPSYPGAIVLGGFLDVAPGVSVPRFGAPGREARVDDVFRQYAFDRTLAEYKRVWETSREVAGEAQSPYAAAVALESWFRTQGGFQYDEQPPPSPVLPPLVDFVLHTKRGYCQHYAGAMAIMLRFLGIPARVAAGFTSGRYDYKKGVWKVTDHDAHTWVEVWFRGYGWLPFDPTPARGRLSAPYTAASPTFDIGLAASILGAAIVSGSTVFDVKLNSDFGDKSVKPVTRRLGDVPRPGGNGPVAKRRHEGESLLRFLALVALAVATGIVLVKVGVRAARFVTRDPRRIAAACRRDLADYLADQRVVVPASATLRELGAVVTDDFLVDASPFVSAATAARYGPPPGAPDAARRARRELRELRRSLRARLSPLERARGLLSLRSLGFAP